MLLYQTLLGAWPLFTEEVPDFKVRLKDYMIKAVREAKAITNWININKEYEDAILSFIEDILKESADNEFLTDFLKFQRKIAWYGAFNSLSQVLLKIASPGIPDFYQGTELWDFSLVDPDNRRPVDFEKRKRLLDGLLKGKPPIDEMLASWKGGRIKLYTTYKALNARRTHRDLFQNGEYIPLKVEGERQEHVCSFVRQYGGKRVLVAVPRFYTGLSAVNVPPVGKLVWENDHILLPEDALRDWLNIFTGVTVHAGESMALADLFSELPVAMLVSE
jgi:(1->4)-alpha-D-glucan 1-alpha-D-glucosylmutase